MSAENREGIEFIRQVRKFGEDVLGLNFGGSFQEISDRHTECHWLYASYSDRIESPWDLPYVFSWNKAELSNKEKKLSEDGYDTFLYSAEAHGGENCPILRSLLKASPQSQLYVVLHEGYHTTNRSQREERDLGFMPYDIEEASGRLVGMMGPKMFAEAKGNKALQHATAVMADDWLRFCKFVNRWREELISFHSAKTSSDPRNKLLDQIDSEAEKLTKKLTDADLIGVLNKEINNAFFLRYGNYTVYYPLMLDLYDALDCNIVKFMDAIIGLPADKQKALNQIQETIS